MLSPASVGRSELAESDGFRQKGKVRGVEGLPVNLAAWLGRPCRPQDGKGKLSVPEALADVRLVSESPCRTGKPGRAVGLKR